MFYTRRTKESGRTLEFINARRENKKQKTKDYQVKLKGYTIENMLWISREILIKMGFILLVQRCDEKEAAAAGLINKNSHISFN